MSGSAVRDGLGDFPARTWGWFAGFSFGAALAGALVAGFGSVAVGVQMMGFVHAALHGVVPLMLLSAVLAFAVRPVGLWPAGVIRLLAMGVLAVAWVMVTMPVGWVGPLGLAGRLLWVGLLLSVAAVMFVVLGEGRASSDARAGELDGSAVGR